MLVLFVLLSLLLLIKKRGNQPNFLVVVIDTLREDLAGAKPPFFEALKKKGLYFENCFTTTPITLPAHLSLFTSKLPHQTEVLTNGVVYKKGCKDFLTHRLKKRGYYNFAVISLGTLSSYYGLGRCFDFYEDSFPPTRWYRRADEVNRVVLENIEQIKKPYFFFLHYSEPHEPYVPPYLVDDAEIYLDGEKLGTINFLKMEKHRFQLDRARKVRLTVRLKKRPGVRRYFIIIEKKRYEITGEEITLNLFGKEIAFKTEVRLTSQLAKQYYREEILFWDEEFKKLYQELERRGLLENTYIFILSDHGEGLGEWRNHQGHIHFLNGLYTRIPLLILGPGIKPGKERRLCSIVDLYPTILKLAGIKPERNIEGTDLFSDPGHSYLFLQTHRPESYFDRFSVVKLPYQLIHTPRKRLFYLFNVDQDRFSLHPIENKEEMGKLLPLLINFEKKASRSKKERKIDRKTEEILKSLGYVH